MPNELSIIDNVGLHRRTELLLSQALTLLIIKSNSGSVGIRTQLDYLSIQQNLIKTSIWIVFAYVHACVSRHPASLIGGISPPKGN